MASRRRPRPRDAHRTRRYPKPAPARPAGPGSSRRCGVASASRFPFALLCRPRHQPHEAAGIVDRLERRGRPSTWSVTAGRNAPSASWRDFPARALRSCGRRKRSRIVPMVAQCRERVISPYRHGTRPHWRRTGLECGSARQVDSVRAKGSFYLVGNEIPSLPDFPQRASGRLLCAAKEQALALPAIRAGSPAHARRQPEARVLDTHAATRPRRPTRSARVFARVRRRTGSGGMSGR